MQMNAVPVLIFLVGDQTYALRVSDVREVATMVELIKVPQPKKELLGLINRHGDIIPLLDLRIMLDALARPLTAQTFFLVAERYIDEERVVRIGLVVDHILQVKYYESSAFQRIAGNPFVQTIVNDADEIVEILELDPILARYIAQIES